MRAFNSRVHDVTVLNERHLTGGPSGFVILLVIMAVPGTSPTSSLPITLMPPGTLI